MPSALWGASLHQAGRPPELLYALAALGGQKALVDELLPTLTFRSDKASRALAPLVWDEDNGRLGALLSAWSEASTDDGDTRRKWT